MHLMSVIIRKVPSTSSCRLLLSIVPSPHPCVSLSPVARSYISILFLQMRLELFSMRTSINPLLAMIFASTSVRRCLGYRNRWLSRCHFLGPLSGSWSSWLQGLDSFSFGQPGPSVLYETIGEQ